MWDFLRGFGALLWEAESLAWDSLSVLVVKVKVPSWVLGSCFPACNSAGLQCSRLLILELLWNALGFSLSVPVPEQGGVDGAPKALEREPSGSRHPQPFLLEPAVGCPREMPQCSDCKSGVGEFCPFFPTSVLVFILFFWNRSLFSSFVFDFHPFLGVLGHQGSLAGGDQPGGF